MMMFLATENINTSAIHHNTKRRYKLLVLVSLSQLLEVRYSEDAPALSMVLFRSSLASEAQQMAFGNNQLETQHYQSGLSVSTTSGTIARNSKSEGTGQCGAWCITALLFSQEVNVTNNDNHAEMRTDDK